MWGLEWHIILSALGILTFHRKFPYFHCWFSYFSDLETSSHLMDDYLILSKNSLENFHTRSLTKAPVFQFFPKFFFWNVIISKIKKTIIILYNWYSPNFLIFSINPLVIFSAIHQTWRRKVNFNNRPIAVYSGGRFVKFMMD